MSPVLPLDPARWRRIESILDLALDLSPMERSSLLDESCAGDPDLRAEVEAVLAADAQAGDFLATPAGDYAPDLLADSEDEGEPDLSGYQMGPYRLLREIGGGGMGTVYEAEDTRLGRRVAIKLLPPEYSRDRRAKERFLREARSAAAVDHPNLCTIHDVGESGGRLYIVLSFYEGETLRERIRRGPLSLAEARDVAMQVARGLARAHEAGIVHRDIKPANVILTRRGEAKILDFGIARLAGDEASLTRTGASWGTPAYMSPEQARGEPVDERTDVWSLGVMLYEMLAGRRPFGGEGMEAVVTAILTRKPEPLERARPDVPPELAHVVERALTKDPEERYGSAAELLGDLAEGREPERQRWKRKALRTFLVVGVLSIAGVLLFLIRDGLLSKEEQPLRVAVLRPVVEVEGRHSELAFVPSEVVEAALSSLLALEGLQPLDPPERDERNHSQAENLRAADADEVLLSRLECQDDFCRVRFHRQKPGGEILGRVGPFEVPIGIENAYQLADAVRIHLQRIYPNHQPRPGSPGEVQPQDYSAYIELEREVDRGELLGKKDLARLDALLRSSPGLVGAYVLAAGISRSQDELDRALDYAEQGEKIAPHDPRPLFVRLRIETRAGLLNEAEVSLKRLAGLAPGDIRVERGKAELLEARGQPKEAHALRQKIAQRRPTWRNIRELAMVEITLGESEAALRRLRELLEAQPNNRYVLEDLAVLELTSGDLNHAAALYERLIRAQPDPPFLLNLGFIRYLLGDYPAAVAAYRRALVLNPGHRLTRFNLATSLEAQGYREEARSLYRTLEKELSAAQTPLDTQTRMWHAQCLARLGRRVEAARIGEEILERRPEDVYELHQAARLYALLGNRSFAVYYTQLALEKGLRREWFTIPSFNLLQEDPDFRDLLDAHSPKAPS